MTNHVLKIIIITIVIEYSNKIVIKCLIFYEKKYPLFNINSFLELNKNYQLSKYFTFYLIYFYIFIYFDIYAFTI